jgi:hypothetical protein
LKNSGTYHVFWLLCILTQPLLLASCYLAKEKAMGMSGKMLCFFILSDAQLDYFGCGLFFSLDYGSRSVLAFQKRTSFGFVLLIHVMLT